MPDPHQGERPPCNWPHCHRSPNPCFMWCKCRCHRKGRVAAHVVAEIETLRAEVENYKGRLILHAKAADQWQARADDAERRVAAVEALLIDSPPDKPASEYANSDYVSTGMFVLSEQLRAALDGPDRDTPADATCDHTLTLHNKAGLAQVKCSCGWTGQPWPTGTAAVDEHRRHVMPGGRYT